jgi:tRNA A37 threonylcarbamoyladenosine synthetase subunit TsaC/SUA5/YrdC
VDLSVEPPQILRAGPITIADLQVVLPEIVTPP